MTGFLKNDPKQRNEPMTRKEKNRQILLAYMGDPENDFPNRSQMALSVLGYKQIRTMYFHFSPDELYEIEIEAWEIRKKRTIRQRSDVYHALYKRAIGFEHPDVHISNYQGDITKTDIIKVYPPDPSAAKEFLERTEGKTPDTLHINPSSIPDIAEINSDKAAEVYKNVLG